MNVKLNWQIELSLLVIILVSISLKANFRTSVLFELH